MRLWRKYCKEEQRVKDAFARCSGRTGIPLVLFTRCRWLKTEECFMPVFDSGTALAFWLRRQGKDRVLSPEQVDAVATAVAAAKPWEAGKSGAEVTGARTSRGGST